MRSGLRAFLIFALCLTAVAAFFGQTRAADRSPARQALEITVTRVLELLKNPDYADPAKRPAIRNRIEAEARRMFDFGEFSARTVGPAWRNFTPEQRALFSDSFSELLLSTYLDRINGYNGERITYTGETVSPEGDRVEVSTNVTLKNGRVVPVAYRMLPKNDGWWIYDVLVEGISLVKNYRTQFQDILSRGAPEQLIARVREKSDAIRRKNHAAP